MIHTHSILSNKQTKRYKRRQLIYDALDRPLTDRQVLNRIGMNEMNAVRPRITEMVNDGLLLEFDSIKDPSTNRRVRRVVRWDYKPKEKQLELL